MTFFSKNKPCIFFLKYTGYHKCDCMCMLTVHQRSSNKLFFETTDALAMIECVHYSEAIIE